MGVTTMKMMSRTRQTSTRGVTLMSPLTSSGLPPPAPNAIDQSSSDPRPRARLILHEVVDQLRRRIRHLDLKALDFVQEVVVEPDGRNRDEQSECGRAERFGDSCGDGTETAGAAHGHALERGDDPDDGAEQSDEGSGGGDRGQVAEALFHFRGGHERFALDGTLARIDDVEVVRKILRGLVLKLSQPRDEHAGQMAVPVFFVLLEIDRLLELVLLEKRRDALCYLQRLFLRFLQAIQTLDRDGQRPDRH